VTSPLSAGLTITFSNWLVSSSRPLTFSVYWNACPAGAGAPDLARGDLLALLAGSHDDVLWHQPARIQLVRIEPDPHRILAGAKHRDVADAGQSATARRGY
jgi:hypothetical protein